MKAYPIKANPDNGMRHDAGITLDSFDEFNSVIPHLVGHLRKKQQEADPVSADAIDKRITGIEAVHQQLLFGDIDDGTWEIRLTPIESEAVYERLIGSSGVVSDEEIALGGIVGCHLAQQYHEQYGLRPDNTPEQEYLIPSMRLSAEPIDVPAL